VPRTQYYVAQSLDGYIAESDGGLDWLLNYDGEAGSDASQATDGEYDHFFAQVGAIVMGSGTYEFILAEEDDRWPYAGTPCWVFSSRELPVPDGGGVRFARGPVAPVHEQLRAAAGERNVWIVGGGGLASDFADAGLLDELLLTVVPVVLGDGLPTFERSPGRRLHLSGVRPFSNGMTELCYDVGLR